jgi:hypothetical protein
MRVAYGCVLLAAELLREEASGAIAGLDLDDSQSAAPRTPRGGLASSMVRKVSAPRRWKTSPHFPGLEAELPAGAEMAHPLFPIVWGG